MLDVSPFSLAERTAFVGRESEGSAIRAAIDRARAGHGSVVMLCDGPGVGKTRLAMEMAEYASRKGFRCAVGHCYERDEPFPFSRSPRLLKAIWRRQRAWMTTAGRWGPTQRKSLRLRPAFDEFFRDIPQPLELPPAQQRRYLFQSYSEALARAARTRPTVTCLRTFIGPTNPHWLF